MELKALVLYDVKGPYIRYKKRKHYLQMFKRDYPEFTIERAEYQPTDAYIYMTEKRSYEPVNTYIYIKEKKRL